MNTFLILHGWGSCAGNWLQVKKILENQGNKVFLPDLPGFGESPPPSKAWSLNDYVEWVREFCEKNNLSPSSAEQGEEGKPSSSPFADAREGEGGDGSRNSVHLTPRLKPWQTKFQRPQFFLLGHSFGGAVAVKFALKHPEKVRKMFLLANSGIRKKSFKKEIFKKIANFFKNFSFLPFYASARKVFYKIFVPKSDYLYLKKNIMKETYLKVINEDISSCFSQVSVPTVIIWGDQDDVVPIKDAYFINQAIKNSNLIIIPGAGHDLERRVPEILVEKIIQHLK